jgi:hypothetical protein
MSEGSKNLSPTTNTELIYDTSLQSRAPAGCTIFTRRGLHMRVQMESEIANRYKSASQRARVVTELWGEGNLY